MHIPDAILAIIASCVSEDGVDALKNLILAGPQGTRACLSPETLSRVRLDKSPLFVWMCRQRSRYYPFYAKCLQYKNPYALYVESLKRAFVYLDLSVAITILRGIKDVYPLAHLLLIMLNNCAGDEDLQLFNHFRRVHYRLSEVQYMADALIYHINRMHPRRQGSFEKTWHFELFPECWDAHRWLKEINGERCLHCIYFYLSREICCLS